ncbi:MAG TPA: response regulator [Candidatus Sulfotelmatobacter sp.]|nr:response regulator [Candidatus Sulfotelmatobacter sp.]
MKILIVEDSRMLRLAIERSLVRAGYEVISAGDGEQGLALAQRMQPDVILLDMMLPLLEGTSVLRELRQHSATTNIPVIILSGLSQKNEEKLKTAGALAYFEKSKLDLENGSKALIQILKQVFAWRELAKSAH